MELTIRDWMVVIGAGLILAVLVDAARRVYRERRSEVRLNARIHRRGELEDDEDEAFNLLSELPNGGARIVTRDDLAPTASDKKSSARNVTGQQSEPEQRGDTFVNAVPSEGMAPVADPIAEPLSTDPDDLHRDDVSNHNEAFDIPSFSALDDDDLPDLVALTSDDRSPTPDAKTQPQGVAEAPETLDWLEQLEEPEPEEEPEARLPRDIDPHVFVLNVTARKEVGFSGRDIMQILLACDLRFGDMDFFHRHEQSAGKGPIQFSVCNMMKPGVFDIDNMDSLQTRGLMFFVTLPGPEDMLKAFDYMYETAKTVAKNLDGDVLDETRSAVTRQSLEHMRQQIRELERRIAMDSRR